MKRPRPNKTQPYGTLPILQILIPDKEDGRNQLVSLEAASQQQLLGSTARANSYPHSLGGRGHELRNLFLTLWRRYFVDNGNGHQWKSIGFCYLLYSEHTP